MARKPTNQGKAWTSGQESQLKKLARGNTPTGLMGYRLGRSQASVQSKAQELGVSLHPTNKSPYNRRGK